MVERSGSGTSVAPDKKKEVDKPAESHQHDDPAHRLSQEGNTQARPDAANHGTNADRSLPPVTIDQSKQPARPGEQTPGTPPTQADLPKPRQLNDETIKKYADDLHAAVTKEGWFSHDPDKDKIFKLLNSLGEADRKALEQAYVNANGNGDHKQLRDELKDRLDGDDWRKAEARLNTHDNRTNDAGNLMVALSAINDNRGDAERRVIETFATLNSDQRKLLDQDFQKDYGMSVDEALKKYGVSEDGMKALNFVNKPIDQRTSQDIQDFAKFAVDKGSMDYLAVALRGETPAAVEARKALQQDQEFVKNLVDKFKPHEDTGVWGAVKGVWNSTFGDTAGIVSGIVNGDLTWGKVANGIPLVYNFNKTMDAIDAKKDSLQLMTAMDYLREGHASLSTIALNNSGSLFGWFDNKDNIRLAVDNATDQEKQAFQLGKQLQDSGRQPANDQEKSALTYYQQTHKAFEDSGDKRESAQWEAKLLYGKDSVQAKIAGSDNQNGRFSALENLTENEWKALKDPTARADLDKFLGRFVDDNERTRMMQIVEGKAGKENFHDAQGVHRTLDEVIEQNKGSKFLGMGTSYDGKNIANAIANISPEEAQKYKDNADFRKKVDDFVKDNLGDNEKAYAERLLRQTAQTGKQAEIGQPEKILQNQMNGVEPKTALGDIEKLLQSDPELRKRLSGDISKMSDEDKALRQAIDHTMNDAIFNSPGYRAMMIGGAEGGGMAGVQYAGDLEKRINGQLWKKGTVPPDVKAELNLKNEKFFEDAATLSKEDRDKLYKSNNLTKDEQQLIDAIASQGGKMNLDDRMRAFVLGNGAAADDFKGALAKLTDDEKQSLKETYAKKYGHPLEEDFLGKIDKNDQQQFKDLLTPGKLDGRQDYYDNLEEYLKSRSGGGFAPDATGLTVERAINDQAALHQWFNHQFERMPPDVQDAARAYFKDALEQHKQSKEKLAEIMATVAITAAALAATPFTGGTSLALVASVAFVAGGVAKVAIHRAIEGGDYDWNKALGQFVGGGSEAALNFLGGKIVEGMFKGFNVAGNALYADMMGAGVLAKETEQAVVGRAFTKLIAEGGKNVSEDGLATFVKAVAPNATAEEAAAIRTMAQRAVAENYDAILNRASRVALGGVDNAIIGAGAGEGSLIINAAIQGREISAEEFLRTALVGGATGAIVGTVLRGAVEGHDIYVQSKKTADGNVIVPSGPGERPIKLRDSQGHEREVTTELKPKPDEVIVDGPQADPRLLEPLAAGDGKTIMVDGKAYRTYDLTGPDGKPITIDRTKITLGRSDKADLAIPGDADVSRFHAQIEFTPDGPRIRDLNSLNGTYVNGQKIPREGLMLKPGDKIALADNGTSFTFGEHYRPDAYRQHSLEINGKTVPIDKPNIVLGRSPETDVTFGNDIDVSRRHAEIKFTDKGPMIHDLGSTNGTYVNGQRITGDVKLNPGDKVKIGNSEFVFRDSKYGLEALRPHEVMEYRPQGGRDNAARPESVKQSNEYKENHEVRGKIQDGFQMLSGNERIRPDGTWNDPYRPSTVVDRTQDKVLNETIREAHQRFDRIAERMRNATNETEKLAAQRELATELAKYSKDKMHPLGWSEEQVDAAYFAFREQNAGKRVLIGDYITRAESGQGAGVCQHQALLFKVLADDFNLDAALVAGHYGRKPTAGFMPGHQPNHAWNEVRIGNDSFVFDPRQEHFYKDYNALDRHTPGRDFSDNQAVKFEDVAVKRGDRVTHDGTYHWRVDGFNPRTGDVVITHPAQRPVTMDEFRALNGNEAPRVGKFYHVRRSDGSVEFSWQYQGVNQDGTLRMWKADGIRREISRVDLAKENPYLLKANRGEIMSSEDANAVLDNPKSSTKDFVDAAYASVLSDSGYDSARVAQQMRERIKNDPELMSKENFEHTMGIIGMLDTNAKNSLMGDVIRHWPIEKMSDRAAMNELMSQYHVADAATKANLQAAVKERIGSALDTAGLNDFSSLTEFAKAMEVKNAEAGDKFTDALRRISKDEKRLTPDQIKVLRDFQKTNGNIESANMLGLYERAVKTYQRDAGPWWNRAEGRDWRLPPIHERLSEEQLDKLWNVAKERASYNGTRMPEPEFMRLLSRLGLSSKEVNKEPKIFWKGTNDQVKYVDGKGAGHGDFHGRNKELNQVYVWEVLDGLIGLGEKGRLR
jgi:pSer/pThr/pTyr-binding forkhead associated (FHA) protein